jgi:hypothetical protein
MSDTPETDHIENNLGNAAHPVLSCFCRQLERERDEAREITKNLSVALTAAIRSANTRQEETEHAMAERDRLRENTIRHKEEAAGLLDKANIALRVKWVNALRAIVGSTMPQNKSGVSLVSDIDLILASDEQRFQALEKIK